MVMWLNEAFFLAVVVFFHKKCIHKGIVFDNLNNITLKCIFSLTILKGMIISFCNIVTICTLIQYTYMLNLMTIYFFGVQQLYIFTVKTHKER